MYRNSYKCYNKLDAYGKPDSCRMQLSGVLTVSMALDVYTTI